MAQPAIPAAPFVAPFSGTADQKLSMLANELSRKADQTAEPVYSAVLLIAPDNSVWRVSVDATGTLSTVAVPRPR